MRSFGDAQSKDQRDITIPSADFIAQMLEIAQKTFIQGQRENETLKDKVRKDPPYRLKMQPGSIPPPDLADRNLSGVSGYRPQFQDPHFLTYDANLVLGTNFIAACGPSEACDVARFLYNIAFNPALKHP